MNNNKLSTSHIIYASFMLFSIFFGAGNMIFPPSLGQQAGTQAPLALLGFSITDAGLAALGIIAVVVAGNNMDDLVSRAGKKFGVFLTMAIYLLIGPLFAIPRTGAVSFEVGIVPFLPEGSSRVVPMLLYTAVFFALTYFFSLKPTKIIDIVGKVMSPILLLSILLIFVTAMLNPLGEVIEPTVEYANGPFVEGLLQGYLALDGFGAPVFAIIIVDIFKEKGVTDRKSIVRYTCMVGLIAAALLCLVYGELCLLGAQTSAMEPFANGGVLLSYAVHTMFGKWGNVILGVAMVMACLTTSIGLTTSFGDYFSKRYPNLKYRNIIGAVCVFTWIVSNIGLDMLMHLVLPILVVLYPLLTVLVLLSFFDRFWHGRTEVYLLSMVFALLFSIFDGFKTAGIALGGLTERVMRLPLASVGVGWLIPAAIGFILAMTPIGKKFGEYLRRKPA